MTENKKELEELGEKKISSEKVFDGVMLHVEKDTVRLPNGATSGRELIRHVGAVAVIPIDGNGNVIMERQFRYPIDEVITEIPAGKLNYKGEDHRSAAERELREETGYIAKKWTELGYFYPAAAYSDEKIMMFLAEDLEKGERELDEDEFLNVFTVPLSELYTLVMDGKICDAKTQVAILKAHEILENRK